ncbi:hypothetical protein FKP32DRAFT_1760532 [Trametes sanguinea]|nr:hypothetical protein FKP32DRAFT_1760532 [Trametes sanguinea]
MYKVAVQSVLHRNARWSAATAMKAASSRLMSSGHPLVRPAPPPLPREQQREFEELVRAAQAPLANSSRVDPSEKEADMAMHPDARAPIVAEFEGDVNPVTGEKGGPKREPLADSMTYFHNHFKHEFDAVYELADGSFTKRGMSLPMYLRLAAQLAKGLTAHHTIEERYIFPILAKRMTSFKDDEVHLKSHEAIHHGLDELNALIRKWSEEPSTYKPEEMRACLDSWREVLFKHLDQEVQDLSGENMKKYWTLEELERIPI